MSRVRGLYGTTPLHLLGHVAAFALTAYAISRVVDLRGIRNVAIWFLAAVLLHDLVFLPLYSVLDRIAGRGTPARATNFLRVPAIVSGVLLLVFLPRITSQSPGTYRAATGFLPEDYLRNWLLIVAVLFAASAILYAITSRRRSRERPPARADARGPEAPRPRSSPSG